MDVTLGIVAGGSARRLAWLRGDEAEGVVSSCPWELAEATTRARCGQGWLVRDKDFERGASANA
jgi:hypothetical protein